MNKSKSLFIFDFYFNDLTTSGSLRRIEEDIFLSDEEQEEDIFICEKVQRVLESKGYNYGRFSPKEETEVYHIQSLLEKYFQRFINEHL